MRRNIIGIFVIAIMLTAANLAAYAETGQGKDVFKVIMTAFGVEGDMVALVTVNDGEASRVKFIDSSGPLVKPVGANSTSTDTGDRFIEYVATFPNTTVDVGAEYHACVLTVADLNMICSVGQNSPASRPEFVDVSLLNGNATSNDNDNNEEEN